MQRIAQVLIIVALIAAPLAGCKREPIGTPPAVQTLAAAAPAAPTAAFALVSSGSEVYDNRPALVLKFSRPLVSQQAFDQLLSVKRKDGADTQGSWVLDADQLTLRFPYIDANRDYVVTVKKALTASDGSSLDADLEKSVYSGKLPPQVGFASQGNILPSHDSRGLPIVAVNVAEVDLDFFRIRDSDLPSFLNNYQKNGRRSYWSMQQLLRYGESVYANRFALHGEPNERAVSFVPVRDIDELRPAGLYFAVLKKAGDYNYEFDTAMFFVSDIGLHVRVYKDGMLVQSNSLESGEPKPGVALEMLNERGERLFQATTDQNGLAQLAFKPGQGQLLTARFGRDVAMLSFSQPALDLSEFSLGGRAQTDLEIFPWSGRDLYRPGEQLRVSALLRDFDGRMVKPQPLFVTLKQPDGRALATQQLTPGELDYVAYERQIPADAATGKWTLELSTEPNMANAVRFPFRVEEFLPERLKLVLDAPERLQPGNPLALSVEGAWLYGSPAAGNRFTARLSLQLDPHPVESLKDFYFGDALMTLPQQPVDVLDQVLDAEGRLSAEIPLADAKAPAGPVAAVLAGSLYESGGRAVTRALKRTIWPASELVGVRPLFELGEGATPDGEAVFEVLRATASGEETAATDLKVRLLRDRRQYNWRWVDGSGWQTDYLSSWETLSEQSLSIQAGHREKIRLPVSWGGYRLEIFDPSTELTLRLPFEAGWGWYNEGQEAGSRPDKVKLALDKPAYAEGDTVKLTIKPPHPGRALVLLESDHLLWQQSIEVKGETTVAIPLDPSWRRHDLYATALVFRPGSTPEKITPSRAVGLIRIPLDRSQRELALSIDAVAKTRPGEPLTVTVKAPGLAGQNARAVLHAVDVGILNLTGYALPDPNAWWFASRRYGTESWDVYGRIIEALDGSKARLRYGGDAALLSLPSSRRPNVKVQTVDLFEQPLAFDKAGNARFELAVPDFNGTLRLAAVVYGEQRFGSIARETIVQAPLVVEISAPRAMAAGDQAEIALDLENLSGVDGDYQLSLDGGDLLEISQPKRHLKLADQARSTQTFAIVAREKYGVATVTARVTGGAARVERKVEFALRPAYPAERRARVQVLDSGVDVRPDARLRAGLVSDSVLSRITLGTLPPMPFASVVRDLIDYPYGCVEQTTSKAFPLVYLDDATADQFGVAPLAAEDRRNRINAAFSRLASMQTENGNFSYWPGSSYVVTHITPYVAEMLVAAKQAGFEPDAAFLEKTLKRLNDDLLAGGNPHYEYDYSEHLRIAEQAHAAYVLARLKRAPLGTLRALYDNERSKLISPLPLVHLGVALTLMGDHERGEAAISEAFSRKFDRPVWLGDYGSNLRDWSLMVAIVNEQGLSKPEYDARAYEVAREWTGRQTQWFGSYLSTQEQISIFRLGRSLLGDLARKIEGDVQIGGQHEPFAASAQVARSFVAQDLAQGVTLSPRGAGPIFLVEDVVGYPAKAPRVEDQDVAIRRRYYRQDGSEYDGRPLTTGEVLVAALEISAKGNMQDALIADLVPGGLELENLNLGDQTIWNQVKINGVSLADRAGQAEIRYEEYRDDRYVAAIELSGGQTARLYYLLRAVSPGRYRVPSPLVEDMYRPTLRGVGAATPERIEVHEPK